MCRYIFSNLNANCRKNHFKLSIRLKYDWNKDSTLSRTLIYICWKSIKLSEIWRFLKVLGLNPGLELNKNWKYQWIKNVSCYVYHPFSLNVFSIFKLLSVKLKTVFKLNFSSFPKKKLKQRKTFNLFLFSFILSTLPAFVI